MNKRIKWGIISIVAIGITAGTIYSQMPRTNAELHSADKAAPEGKSGGKNRVLNVNAQIIREASLTDEYYTMGVLLPDEMVDLSFESSGKVVLIAFDEGSHVRRGQLLAKVNDSQLQAQLQRLTAQLKLAEDRVYRQQALLNRDAVSREALEQVEADLAMLRADIAMVKANIAMTELHAPFDGIIGLRQISVGSYATTATAVACLTKTSPLKVEFSVPERYASQIRKGTRLAFTVEGSTQTYAASVYATESTIDPKLHQYTIRALYPNDRNQLMPGRYANIRLQKEHISNAIAIPAEAIVPEMGKDKVFVYRSGEAQPVDVITGIRTEGDVQIVQGLQRGDTIITSGTLQLRMGLKVKLDNIQ